MATFYVKLEKQDEDERSAIYKYTNFDGDREGIISINKKTGEDSAIKLAPGDEEKELYRLAARKLLKHFQSGEFPKITSWVS